MGVTGLASATLPCSNLIRAQVIKFLQEGDQHNIEQESRLEELNLLKLQKKTEFSIHHLMFDRNSSVMVLCTKIYYRLARHASELKKYFGKLRNFF